MQGRRWWNQFLYIHFMTILSCMKLDDSGIRVNVMIFGSGDWFILMSSMTHASPVEPVTNGIRSTSERIPENGRSQVYKQEHNACEVQLRNPCVIAEQNRR